MEAAQSIKKIAADTNYPGVKWKAELAVENFISQADALHFPYLYRIHLVSPDGFPEYLIRGIGFAFSHHNETRTPVPTFQVRNPTNMAELEHWRTQLYCLEPDHQPAGGLDARFSHLRKLVGLQEALALFRLPFPPEAGIPGVTFLEGKY